MFLIHAGWIIFTVLFSSIFSWKGGGQGVHLIRILNAGSGLLGLHCVRFVVLCAGRYGAKFTLNFINADPALLGYFVDFVFFATRERDAETRRDSHAFLCDDERDPGAPTPACDATATRRR